MSRLMRAMYAFGFAGWTGFAVWQAVRGNAAMAGFNAAMAASSYTLWREQL